MAEVATTTDSVLDSTWHREMLEELCAMERETGSPGEREAAKWLVERFAEMGVEARVEEERIHSTFWWPLGLAAAAGVVAGVAGLRGHRLLGAVLGGLAAAAAADDLPPGGRRLRALLPKRAVSQVLAEIGPSDPARTVVLLAHHDAAHSGWVFHPAIPEVANRLGLIERNNTSPPLLAPNAAAPLVAGIGAAIGNRALASVGAAVSAGYAASMAELGSGGAVPGANDNGTGVVTLLAIARALVERPVENLRVLLVSTSEEALCEGMQAFARRHFSGLPVDDTFFLCIDTVGSPHLTVLRGEGMLRLRDYPQRSLALLDSLAEELGIELFPNLRLMNATDGVHPLAAGYQCASLCSCTDLKQPANYHWPTDVPENVDYGSLADAIRLTEAVVRRLDERWL